MHALVRFVITNSRFALFAVALAVLGGLSVYFTQARQEDPEITIRTAQVLAQYPGMSAERVEQLLTRPIEEEIKSLPEVKEIKSLSMPGMAIVLPKLHDSHFDLDPIWARLRNKMDDLRTRLPEGTLGPQVNDDFGRVAVVTLALTGEGFSGRELRWAARWLRDHFAKLPLVAKVDLYGVQEERIWLVFDPKKLNRSGMSPDQVVAQLKDRNIILPGGTVNAQGMALSIEPSGNFESLEDLRRVILTRPDDAGPIRLRDLVEVRRDYVDPPRSPVFFNGAPGVVLGISMVENSNIAELGRQVMGLLPGARAQLPLGMSLDVMNYQPELVAEAVQGATDNLLQTIAVVLGVVMVFLGWRIGLIVGAGIPLTIFVVLVGMSLWGVALHRISIAAIIVALGLLVDNGIVVAEDFKSRMDRGAAKLDAALDASRSLAIPLLNSSLTTILAFLPLMLAENSSGEFLASLSQVVILALLASWFLAVVLTPALCYWLLPETPARAAANGADQDPDDAPRSGLHAFYGRLLGRMLRWRAAFLLGVGALFILSLAGFGLVKQRHMAPSERNQFTVYLNLPAGSDITETIEAARTLGSYLADREQNPAVTGNVAYVASGGPRFFLALQPPDPMPHSAFLVVNTERYEDVAPAMRRVEEFIAARLPQAAGRTESLFLGPAPLGTVELRLSGPDIETLQLVSGRMMAAVGGIPGIQALRSDWENPVLKIRVVVDQERAARAGLTSSEIARSLSGVLDGYKATDFREGETVIPISLRSDQDVRNNLDRLRTHEMFSARLNAPVPLLQVADLAGAVEPSQIRRIDQERTVTVAARHADMGARELYAVMGEALAAVPLPPGYVLRPAGEVADSAESQSKLFQYAPHCLLGIVALLILQFNSLRRMGIVMATIPLVLIGAVAGLLAFRAHFEFTAMLGLFSLAGIIINNGIVMIDRLDQERARGLGVDEAVVRGALARLRPILITTATTVIGLVPMALLGGQFWFSMSIVIMCGLAVGTVLTLGFVPVLYSVLFGLRRRTPPA
ncbi:efflux RND transporter permease subunit [Desulfocurvus sp.]|jgi:multidrug efflux pump subunit AcrB|uniref:efflux RND transporter permease subunit n=1 Tax=Desulfocurvus sp. TaxID=2871698 RepID=UPI0025C244B8|nr:efflux RND transporter permease subunit [Desulfocurvus sp.]MCK9239515.1 efflux RND transporter permease subunit [Desulfocurvus sp.]